MKEIENEGYIENSPIPMSIEETKTILKQMENCICLISKKDGHKGTGFLCNIPFPNEKNLLPFLITNNHILKENNIQDKEIIQLTLNNNINKQITIDNSRLKFTDSDLDVTFIQIDPNKDQIDKFIDIDENIKDIYQNSTLYNNKSIYVLHIPRGDKIKISYGLSKELMHKVNPYKNYYDIAHYCSTDKGSSGGPILSLKSFKVIGIHKGHIHNHNYEYNYNIGLSIESAIEAFYRYITNENKNVKSNKNEDYNNIIKEKETNNINNNSNYIIKYNKMINKDDSKYIVKNNDNININKEGINKNKNSSSEWTLIFETKEGDMTNIRISDDKTIEEAINLYKKRTSNTDKIKFIFNGKELYPKLKINKSLDNLSKIIVFSYNNLMGG